MGNRNTKSSLRNAIIYLNISADSISAHDDKFWGQIFMEDASIANDIIKSITPQEIRMLRDGSPKNFATLAYKMVERLCLATGTLCNSHSQQTAVINATRVLIRIIPLIFEDDNWRPFFEDNHIGPTSELREEPQLVFAEKSPDERDYANYLPKRLDSDTDKCPAAAMAPPPAPPATIDESKARPDSKVNGKQSRVVKLIDDSSSCDSDEQSLNMGEENSSNISRQPAAREPGGQSLMKALICSVCDLLFCPEFTVLPHDYNYLSNTIDAPPEDLKSLPTCDYVWEPGVGFESSVNSTMSYDKNRSELLRTLLACLSATLYETAENSIIVRNKWIEVFTSNENRHALPLFTSLLNVVLTYRPTRSVLPLNRLLYEDNREELVELSIQILIAVLDYKANESLGDQRKGQENQNLFIDYMTRIHRNEDFDILVRSFSRLMSNRFDQGYMLSSKKQIYFEQELLILFWKVCSLNQKFINYLLKSNDVLDIVVAILNHLNENFQDPLQTAIIHIGVFNLLILSGERNFGVKLNKAYKSNYLKNLPDFTGSHADLLIVVFHKLIMYGYDISQLYDFLLTIVDNISPYIKGLTMLAAKCLIQLFETFSSVLVIYTEPNYHPIVVFLLEIFNNIIQYQFDGNANLVYMILTKRNLFISLANLSTTQTSIDKVLKKLVARKQRMLQMMDNDHDETASCGEGADKSKLINEQQQQQQQPGCSDQKNKNHKSLAIVSAISLSSRDNNYQPTRHEVSLVATPDLYHFTHPIHPFDRDHNDPEPAKATCSPARPEPQPSISMDDILDQTNDEQQMMDVVDNRNDKKETEAHQNDESPKGERGDHQSSSPVNDNQELISPDKDLSGRSPSASQDPSKWKPTSEWLKQWKQSLPLQTVLRMIEVLVPQIDQLKQQQQQQSNSGGATPVDENEMIRFLQNGTLVGLLPVPHPIQIRKYRTNSGSTLWFRACTWGVIYVRNSIWIDTYIRLIKSV